MASKLFAKRLFVSSVGLGFRVADRVRDFSRRFVNLAEKHGLERKKPSDPLETSGFHLDDFLFLMRRINDTPPFKTTNEPLCSIIVLAFNKAEYTFQCLRSLFREVDLADVEIIVVNNGSTDSTSEMLSFFGDAIRVVETGENIGFVGGCNSGAEVARGKHLVFLNNDTVVLSGWLENLLKTVEENEDVGAVGSLLLYPDGRVQEAGSIIWRDGRAHHYGWGASPDDRRVLFAREVDYCSGASLLVRARLFRELGGFDERYAPGYYEDSDLCFGVRKLGYKVIYQPASRLVHFEGVTSGNDPLSGMRRFQEINRVKFVEKWKETLDAEHFAKGNENIEPASNRNREPVVLVFDERIPTPDRDAGSLRMLEILKILAKSNRVIFVPVYKSADATGAELLWSAGIETEYIINLKKLLSQGVSTAIFSRPSVAGLLMKQVKRADRNIRLIYDMVDVHFVRLERQRAISGRSDLATKIQKAKKAEVWAASKADVVWCASGPDKTAMVDAVSGLDAVVIPTIHRLKPEGKSFDERAGMIFVGNMKHDPNADAADFLIRKIFPHILRELPDIMLTIVGDGVTPELSRLANDHVEFRAYVPDIDPLLFSARVFIAPLRFGAGSKGKVGEALSFGLPVVTSSIGAEGMGLINQENAMIADDPKEFAQAAVALYRDAALWNKIALSGREHISRTYSPEVIEVVINSSLRKDN